MPHPILFTIPNFITAGSGLALLSIAKRLDRQLFDPAICVLKRGGDLDQEVERLGIPLIEADFTVPAKPYSSLPKRSLEASKRFRSYGFTLWHSFHYLDDYTEGLIARLSGARAWIYTKKNMNWNRRSWQLRTLMASRVAAQNTDMMRDFFAGPIFSRRARLVPRGVDAAKFSTATPGSRFRISCGIKDTDLVVGCVAHLVPVKGHPTLIRAIAGVPGVHLMLAGKSMRDAYGESLQNVAADAGVTNRVHFLGGIRDIAGFLHEVDIFVLPTWAQWRMEGCPVALLEAMASGRPTIATDVPGSRDIIRNETDGLLVPPEDVASLARAISRLASSPEERQRFGIAAKERIQSRYTIEREVADHETLYREILKA